MLHSVDHAREEFIEPLLFFAWARRALFCVVLELTSVVNDVQVVDCLLSATCPSFTESRGEENLDEVPHFSPGALCERLQPHLA
jgi:hypothetical protein